MFMKVEKQITDNILEIRANNFFLFKACLKISTSKVFTVFIVTCIIANSFVLALDRFNIDEDTEKFLEYSNIAFFSVFCLELIIKMIGMGFQQYFRDRFNWFDSLVVLVSTVDFTLNQSNISITHVSSYYPYRLICWQWSHFSSQNLQSVQDILASTCLERLPSAA